MRARTWTERCSHHGHCLPMHCQINETGEKKNPSCDGVMGAIIKFHQGEVSHPKVKAPGPANQERELASHNIQATYPHIQHQPARPPAFSNNNKRQRPWNPTPTKPWPRMKSKALRQSQTPRMPVSLTPIFASRSTLKPPKPQSHGPHGSKAQAPCPSLQRPPRPRRLPGRPIVLPPLHHNLPKR